MSPLSPQLLLLLLIAIRLSLAGPVPTKSFPPLNATSTELYRRQCVLPTGVTTYTCDNRLPTVDEIVAHIRDTSDEGGAGADHRAVFWTNLIHDPSNAFRVEEIGWIQGWMEARGFPFYWYFEHINMHWRTAQIDHIRSNIWTIRPDTPFGPEWEFEICSYQALSAAAIHPDAYLFTRKDTNLNQIPDSIWTRIEYWALTQNPNIKRIYRVDPRNPEEAGAKEEDRCTFNNPQLIWDRERGDREVVAQFWCAVQ